MLKVKFGLISFNYDFIIFWCYTDIWLPEDLDVWHYSSDNLIQSPFKSNKIIKILEKK